MELSLSVERLEFTLYLMGSKILLNFELNFSFRLKSSLIHAKEKVVRIGVNALTGRACVMFDFLVTIVM